LIAHNEIKEIIFVCFDQENYELLKETY
jgi:O-acetyl-ADP-ribose deacetylase (regulator of RNase III)